MSRPIATLPRIVHGLPGRIRVHVPRLAGATQADVDRAIAPLRRLRGVRRVSASASTSNVLVLFDPRSVEEARLLSALNTHCEPVGDRVSPREALAAVLCMPPARATAGTPVAASPMLVPARAARRPGSGAHRARAPRRGAVVRRPTSLRSPRRPSVSRSAGSGVTPGGWSREDPGLRPGPRVREERRDSRLVRARPHADRAPRPASLLALLRSALTVLPRMPIVRGWLVGVLGPVPVMLLTLVPAAITVVGALLSASGPVEWTTASLDAIQLASEVGGALRAA